MSRVFASAAAHVVQQRRRHAERAAVALEDERDVDVARGVQHRGDRRRGDGVDVLVVAGLHRGGRVAHVAGRDVPVRRQRREALGLRHRAELGEHRQLGVEAAHGALRQLEPLGLDLLELLRHVGLVVQQPPSAPPRPGRPPGRPASPRSRALRAFSCAISSSRRLMRASIGLRFTGSSVLRRGFFSGFGGRCPSSAASRGSRRGRRRTRCSVPSATIRNWSVVARSRCRSCDTSTSVPSNCASATVERLARLEVEVVGRLVEQQQVRPLPDDQREREPRLLAAGEMLDRAGRHVAGEIEAAEEVAQLLLAHPRPRCASGARAATRRRAASRPGAARSSRLRGPC